MAKPFAIYASSHLNSQTVCLALAKGTGFPLVAPAPLLAGGMITYGFLRGLLPTLEQARSEGRAWGYVDRGYFRATYGSDFSGYFRVTRGAYQHDGRGEFEPERWARLAIKIAPWRRGRHVLVCPPGDVWLHAMHRTTAKEWLDSTLSTLRAHTDRPIVVRYKPPIGKGRPGLLGTPLSADLQDCHALVTHMSNTAVESVLAGVPVFTTGFCAASAMGSRHLRDIEHPAYPEGREKWAEALACNQWTLAELQKGAANHLFQEQHS